MKKHSKRSLIPLKYFKFLLPTLFLALVAFFWSSSQSGQTKLISSPQPVSQKVVIGRDQALKLIGEQDEVKNYIKEVPNAKILIDHFDQDANSYVIQIFEIKNGHTNTFNWYEINIQNGKIKQLLP